MPKPSHKRLYILLSLLGATTVGLIVSLILLTPGTKPTPSTPIAEVAEVPVVSEVPSTREADLKALADVTNLGDFTLSDSALALLAKNGFVVDASSYEDEFFSLYEANRYSYTPSFVTTDSLLHNYHLIFDDLLKKTEEKYLLAEVKALTASMLKEATTNLATLKGTSFENSARRNLTFFTVGARLLDGSSSIPASVKTEVEAELALINAHDGIAESPMMNMGVPASTPSIDKSREDYSQYIARGHYTKSPELTAYFKAMMWYGRMNFRFMNDDEVRSAVLTTLALQKANNSASWQKIYEPTVFFVGQSDDITYTEMIGAVEKAYGKGASLSAISSNTTGFTALKEALKDLRPPQLNSIPIFNSSITPDRTLATKGFRFMGQRFTVDASIFQRLVDREVTGRMLPNGLDIPAALGSAEALSILEANGDTKMEHYTENMDKLRTYLGGLDNATWTQNLYWSWIDTLRPLLAVGSSNSKLPAFMKTDAWTRKSLGAFLGSWAELKHDTILYAKQVYSEMGGGPEIVVKDDRGYVEPYPEVYAKLASLLKKTSDGLSARGIIDSTSKDNLAKMMTLATMLEEISNKELNGEKLTEADYELIRTYGGQLEHFWLDINKEKLAEMNNEVRNYLSQNPAAVIADVATDPNGQVLEVGNGHVSKLLVVMTIEGVKKIVKGGVFSYYEFPWPLSDRLTDEKWRDLINSQDAPPQPAWTKDFTSAE